MSTYLVAFVIGKLEFLEDKIDGERIVVRVYTPMKKQLEGQLGLSVAVKALKYFENYFGIKYPISKLDLVGLEKFSGGGMENWGLPIFLQFCLLVNPETSTLSKQNVCRTIAHEVVHQWFGNLVTMEWWTDLWLNEGFANFMECMFIDKFFEEHDVWTQFVGKNVIAALELDVLESSHPVEITVSKVSEASETFDLIAYCKGASLLRMLHSFIGDELFREGIRKYLSKWSYRNVKTEDLWNSLQAPDEQNIKEIMSSWTKKKGYPLLIVSEEMTQNEHRVLNITQKIFSTKGPKDCKKNELWCIPISIVTGRDGPEKSIFSGLMKTKSKKIILNNVPHSCWIKINPGQKSFYRVHYESKNLSKSLVQAIENQCLLSADRLGLLNDQFALFQAGVISSKTFFIFMVKFKNEKNYYVWKEIITILGKIKKILQYLDIYPEFKAYCHFLMNTIHSSLGWSEKKEDSFNDKLLR